MFNQHFLLWIRSSCWNHDLILDELSFLSEFSVYNKFKSEKGRQHIDPLTEINLKKALEDQEHRALRYFFFPSPQTLSHQFVDLFDSNLESSSAYISKFLVNAFNPFKVLSPVFRGACSRQNGFDHYQAQDPGFVFHRVLNSVFLIDDCFCLFQGYVVDESPVVSEVKGGGFEWGSAWVGIWSDLRMASVEVPELEMVVASFGGDDYEAVSWKVVVNHAERVEESHSSSHLVEEREQFIRTQRRLQSMEEILVIVSGVFFSWDKALEFLSIGVCDRSEFLFDLHNIG